ncbi:MAG TPA: DNA mismatch repair endonuclease MutL [Desulfosarcina sp.]|nr:DNA mismatch repair endonuclease MutL [Desulfosarcina sp.]
MSSIRILPEILSNKIAAGEVVERPASVVKELVENAIDAGSTRIVVEIEQGGRKLIRVSDNGLGMGRDDALLCLERYATSKIFREPDLFAIRTLGFRGEALPSIASVSRFSLVTREPDADVGTRIEVSGGRITDVADAGAPGGTMITVSGLFFNTPARRKFLKSVNTEMGHIADTLSSMALCRPSTQFRLAHNGRIVKNWAPAADPKDRVADVLGSVIKKELLPAALAAEGIDIDGWVAVPRLNRSTARGIYLFVNGRWVKDRVIQHALFAGYSGRLMKGQYPVAVLFIKVPFDQVDVNVHPTKHEIRFVHQKVVHDAVRDAVADALRRSDPTRWRPSDAAAAALPRATEAVFEPRAAYGPAASGAPSAGKPAVAQTADALPPTPPRPSGAAGQSTAGRAAESAGDAPDAQRLHQPPLWSRRFFADLRLIGQFRGTYIICESDEGLILIDQHAAHERIVFERLKRRSGEERPSSQRLLLPETVELGFRESQILMKLAPELDRYGLEIEPFGGNTFVVKALPTLLDNREIGSMITRIVEKAADIGIDAEMDTIVDGCLMVMACHNAIRAHQRLDDAQIKTMLEHLDACDNPSHCPHGRPVWIRWAVNDLEKRFRRIVS